MNSKKSAIMLKKLKTPNVKTKNPFVEYKIITEIILIANRK